MSAYTSVGANVWSWEPFRRLERHHEDVVGRCTKLFWMWIYTSAESKRLVPGLFEGSITTMADSARIPVDAARTYLDRLLEDDMVEYDVTNRVLRMTVLPDCGESPSSSKAILGWYRRFQTVPQCQVRDAHVTTLRWILDEWCRVNSKVLSLGHQEAWAETFGRIQVPPARRRSPRHQQTDLFTASGSVPASSGSADPKINKLDPIDYQSITNRLDRDPDRDQDQDLRVPEGGAGGARPPRLALVPRVTCLDADDLAAALHATGKFPEALTRAQREALGRAIDACADRISGPEVLDVLRDYVKQGMPQFERADLLTPEERAIRSRGITPELVASPGWLALAIQRSCDWAAGVAAKRALLTENPLLT